MRLVKAYNHSWRIRRQTKRKNNSRVREEHIMRGYQIALIITVPVFVASILVSILFNRLFLFLFLPIGIGWGFWLRGDKQTNSEQQTRWSHSSQTSSSQFCIYCASMSQHGNVFCPTRGKPVPRKISYEDLK